MKKTLLFLVLIVFSNAAFSQKESAWKQVKKPEFGTEGKIRRSSLPIDYKLFQFDYQKFVNSLSNVPKRGEFFGQSNVIVSIPSPDGALVEYRIIEASTFEESLQRQHSTIRSFAGNAVNDAGTVIRFSVSPYNGFSALVRNSDGSTYIVDPYSMDYKTVIIYDRAYSGKANGSFSCTTTDEAVKKFGKNIEGDNFDIQRNADDGMLRRFRMAQSCTGEYANYFGASTAGTAADEALVLAAYNATYTRCNALFEMDFNATMQLIANTTAVIYYNSATDPYSDAAAGTNGAWNGELGATLQSVIGNANYDIGHLFGATGGGGNAGCIGCVCSADNSKGQGYTSPGDGIPEGDNFDVDYVAHEIGHQLGGNHTFTFTTENNAVNMEPGSGVTIMGYAGITGQYDIANHSIPIFHAGTINQITTNIKSKSCPVLINTGNAIPVVTVPSATKTLPRGTAFKLTGSATDANAQDVLSYCWEQVDDANASNICNDWYGTPNSSCYPTETKTNGPVFRSFMPKNNGTRYFPRMEDHVANGIAGNQWEIVPNNPSANRTLNFRLTVRDNRAGGGNNESANVAVTFDRTRGPFLITSQATTGISYTQGSTQNITWSVNSTNLMTGAANVNIKLSTDGGKTFPIILAANTPNDGAQTVTIPNVSAPFCRILIEPTGNDFYAINTTDFAIGYIVNDICNTYTSSGINATIVEQSPLAYQTFNLNVPDNVVISDVNVTTNISHRVNQLYVGINHPDLSFVQLFRQDDYGCGNNISPLSCTFDDSGVAYVCGGAGSYTPSSPLDAFNGKSSLGTWRFRVADVTTVGGPANSGTLNSFSIRICYKEIIETPNACGVITTTWNGSSWSNGVPLKNVAAIINGNYTSTGDLEACSLTVNSGFNVTIASGHSFTIGNEVAVNGSGVLTVENNAALIQLDGDAVNSGNIVVNRNSAPMIRLDYTAWSSPVGGQQLKAFSPNTIDTRFYEYLYTGTTTPTAYQTVNNLTNFVAGKGYVIRVDNNWSSSTPAAYNGQFTGVPFNGDFSMSLGKGFNLLGNPYASPIDADRFLFDNESTVGALYFWTHTVPASGGVYPQNNFASYTTLGGTAAAAGGATPNGTIQVGQGFYVKAYDFGNALFTNAQRVKASVSSQFFRASENASNATPEKHRVWLNLDNATDNFNQILVGYMDGATNGYDNLIDGRVLEVNNTMIYNILDNQEFIIQGKALPFSNEDIVPLGLNAVTAGTYTISIDHVDGLFDNQDIFIKDKLSNIVHDLKASAYTFTTNEGVYNNRFEIVYKNTVLSNEDIIENSNLVVFANQGAIKLQSSKETIKDVIVYDMLGRVLYQNSNVNEKEFSIINLNIATQTLVVKATLVNGQSVTKKVVL